MILGRPVGPSAQLLPAAAGSSPRSPACPCAFSPSPRATDAAPNVAFSTPEHLVQRIRRGLRHIQYRSELMDGCLAETGLTIRAT